MEKTSISGIWADISFSTSSTSGDAQFSESIEEAGG